MPNGNSCSISLKSTLIPLSGFRSHFPLNRTVCFACIATISDWLKNFVPYYQLIRSCNSRGLFAGTRFSFACCTCDWFFPVFFAFLTGSIAERLQRWTCNQESPIHALSSTKLALTAQFLCFVWRNFRDFGFHILMLGTNFMLSVSSWA